MLKVLSLLAASLLVSACASEPLTPEQMEAFGAAGRELQGFSGQLNQQRQISSPPPIQNCQIYDWGGGLIQKICN